MSGQRILGVFLRYFYSMRKGPQHLADIFYWPLLDILLWGLTSFWIQSQTGHVGSMPLLFMTGLIFWQVSWRGSIDISLSLLQEFWQRNLMNFFSTPLKFSEWIVGMLLFSFCKLILTVAFGSLIVYVMYGLNVFSVGWLFLPFMACLLMFGWSVGFLSSSAIIYWGHSVEVIGWVLVGIFAPFSAVFYPVTALPWWAQKVAWCLPTTYIFEGMRILLRTGQFPVHYFWLSLALNSVILVCSLSLLRFMFEKSRQKGLARLE